MSSVYFLSFSNQLRNFIMDCWYLVIATLIPLPLNYFHQNNKKKLEITISVLEGWYGWFCSGNYTGGGSCLLFRQISKHEVLPCLINLKPLMCLSVWRKSTHYN